VCTHSKLREDALRVNLAPETVGGRVFRPVHRHIVTRERDWCCGVKVSFSTVCRRGTWTSTRTASGEQLLLPVENSLLS
jgi:hypothetical protein